VLLTVRTTETAPGRLRAEILVRDSGIGIPEAQREAIFEPFRQAGEAIRRRYGGLGLGLTVARRLAERLGGGIRLESRPGTGSTFILHLPLEAVPAEGTRPAPDPDLAGRRALVLDDNRTAARVHAALLESLGLAVTTVTDGAQGLALLEREPPEVALVDIHMPNVDGWRFAETVGRLDPEARPRLVAVSYDTRLTADRLRARGFGGFLCKPVSRATLAAAVRGALGLPPAGAGGGGPEEAGASTRRIGAEVLLAALDDSSRRATEGRLRRIGCRVETAPDGARLVSLARERVADLVVLDLELPDQSGLDVARAIRRAGVATPVLALTADEREETRFHARAAGIRELLLKPVAPETLRRAVAALVPPAPVPAERPLSVLILEDDERLLGILQRILEKRMPAARVVASPSGVQAAALVGTHRPALVVTDLMMPEMNGVDLVRYLLASPEFGHTAVIVLTALGPTDPMVRAVRALGVSEVLHKPFRIDRFYEAVRRILPGAHAASAPASAPAPAHAGRRKGAPIEALPDPGTVERQLGLSRAEYGEILRDFLLSLPGELDALGGLLESGALSDAAVPAHALKGAAGNLLLEALVEPLKALEAAGQSNDPAAAREALSDLRAAARTATRAARADGILPDAGTGGDEPGRRSAAS
jgi:CheY-like chemotaxis protein/HPt (histidine-containing phosphotransfer) domain-containing protein